MKYTNKVTKRMKKIIGATTSTIGSGLAFKVGYELAPHSADIYGLAYKQSPNPYIQLFSGLLIALPVFFYWFINYCNK